MKPDPERVAIVLAAGSSSRMAGNDKLALPWGSGSLLDQVLTNLQAGGCTHCILVQRDLQGLPERAGVQVVENPEPEKGLAHSIRLGMEVIARDPNLPAVLIALGDMPLVRPETVAQLWHAFEEREDAAIVAPAYRGQRGNPVLFSRALFPELAALAGDRGAGSLLRNHPALQILDLDDPGVVIDIDDSAAYLAHRPAFPEGAHK